MESQLHVKSVIFKVMELMKKILMPGPSFLESDGTLLGWGPGPLIMLMMMMTIKMVAALVIAATANTYWVPGTVLLCINYLI